MENVILVIVLVAVLGGAVAYVIRAKKRGVKCIGCSMAGSCGKKGGACSGCTSGNRCTCETQETREQ